MEESRKGVSFHKTTKCFSCFGDYDDIFEVCPRCGHVTQPACREKDALPEGTLLYGGRFIIGENLTSIGTIKTYKGWDSAACRVVFIKEFFPEGDVCRLADTNGIIVVKPLKSAVFSYEKAKILSESRMLEKFAEHPNILNVYCSFEENNTVYTVTEFLCADNLTCRMRAKPNKLLWQSRAVDIALDVCRALAALHNGGIVYRNICPNEIFICENGMTKLIPHDMCAKIGSNDSGIILNPSYAAPECYLKSYSNDPRSDIYSLGATLYHMLTGERPDEATNRIIDDKLAAPHVIDKDIPENVGDAVMCAMALDPKKRFFSAGEFEQALRGVIKAKPQNRTHKNIITALWSDIRRKEK